MFKSVISWRRENFQKSLIRCLCVQFNELLLKGSVRPDELGVENGINRQIIERHFGAGHSFSSGISCRLYICIFPFPPCIVQCIGKMKKNRRNGGKLSQRFISLSYKCSFRKQAVMKVVFKSFKLGSWARVFLNSNWEVVQGVSKLNQHQKQTAGSL